MIRRQNLVLAAMDRIRDVVVAQEHARAEQRSRDEASKARQSELSEDSASFHEKQEGGGGFAGADPKKTRRGVRAFFLREMSMLSLRSATHLQADVTAVTEQRHQNGEEDPMALEPFVMLVVFVSFDWLHRSCFVTDS